jgi:hypothetical protein
VARDSFRAAILEATLLERACLKSGGAVSRDRSGLAASAAKRHPRTATSTAGFVQRERQLGVASGAAATRVLARRGCKYSMRGSGELPGPDQPLASDLLCRPRGTRIACLRWCLVGAPGQVQPVRNNGTKSGANAWSAVPMMSNRALSAPACARRLGWGLRSCGGVRGRDHRRGTGRKVPVEARARDAGLGDDFGDRVSTIA